MAESTGLAQEQLRTLDRLRGVSELEGFYLAGGSAVGFHLGHRRSRDLDLFSETNDVELRALVERLSVEFADVEVVAETDVALHLLIEGEPVDIVRYPYPPLQTPTPGPAGFRICGLLDLAVMKLSAIGRRGLRRDFWDLEAICESGLDLRDIGAAYTLRFGIGQSDLYHVARSLTYFDDAEKDPALPDGLSPAEWSHIKSYFRERAPDLLASGS